jgi:hypothetical protein
VAPPEAKKGGEGDLSNLREGGGYQEDMWPDIGLARQGRVHSKGQIVPELGP